ncbi:MAG: hypothetical protein RLZZ399_1741 [Verrucomicrobiota bacterium]|jgi:gamma-glutamyltranspeptidase
MPQEAISAPRFLTSHFQDSFNPALSDPLADLTRRGHAVHPHKGFLAQPVMVDLDPPTGTAHAASQRTSTFRGKSSADLDREE